MKGDDDTQSELEREMWNEPVHGPESPLLLVEAEKEETTIRIVSDPNLPIRKSSTSKKRSSIPREPLHDASLAFDYNPAVVAYVSSGRTHQPKTLKRKQKASTSTIFENSPLAPVTIIVTTPEEEIPTPPETPVTNTFNEIRSRRSAITVTRHAPSMSTDSLFTPNTSLLMPPTERQIDQHRLRKAKEFREIRKFLIDFLNTKGDQFPKKLRNRMMDLYSINNGDLDPNSVARFDLEIKDEGVALDQFGIYDINNSSDADDLKILAMVFQSQIPVVTPTREQAQLNTVPPFKNGAMNRRSTLSTRSETRLETRPEEDETPPTWLGPLINLTESEPSPPAEKSCPEIPPVHRLTKSTSEPNMQRGARPGSKAPPVPPIPADYDKSVARVRSSTISAGKQHVGKQLLIVEHQTRLKKQNIISGAFGAVREAFGSSTSRSAKAAQKKKLMREAQ
jgi:hypothetical protein